MAKGDWEKRNSFVKEGDTIHLMDHEVLRSFKIGPKCDTDSGRWCCVTHDKVFFNNFDKDEHLRKGTHVLTWFCSTHGPEVP